MSLKLVKNQSDLLSVQDLDFLLLDLRRRENAGDIAG
jgi:hypothetical protein